MKRVCFCLLIAAASLQSACSNVEKDAAQWQEDYLHQPIAQRPQLEVTYTDASRTAFEIKAQAYNLIGQLQAPHLLSAKSDEKPWLWFEVEDRDGTVYSSRNYTRNSRINLYRRGPYYSEIHWFDINPTSADGDSTCLRADLTLFCYPEKILADITWHATGAFSAKRMQIKGVAEQSFDMQPFTPQDTLQSYSFPLFGEEAPLPHSAFVLLEGMDSVRYDYKRGCYMLGTHTSGSFQTELYETPNKYETATFSVANDDVKRKIYICHESSQGGGIVEGGILLDQEGNPMPIVVQVSKNFAGEKEEPFYNPTDIPFSETFFPLYLDPGEKETLTSLHLYQNWGRHMTKHWSSLGAWMDYFHSSTGVTETTCYVPFKFAGLGGVSIADFRAMSQESFWSGQPQHDNVAGHSFLSYFNGKEWIHSVYTGTTYRSTGPNWYDIGLHYLSADGKIKATVDIYETPQSDELRSYFNIRYEILDTLTIEDAKANFRMLNITSRIQSLRYDRFAGTGLPEVILNPADRPFPVKGAVLPEKNFFMALYGDTLNDKGSNAIVVKNFTAEGLLPAATVQLGGYNQVFNDEEPDTRLCLVPYTDRLELHPGAIIHIEGYWLPYGAALDTRSPEMVALYDAASAPHIVSARRGEPQEGLPIHIKAVDNRAEFTIAGGKNLIPVVVTGLTQWRLPRLFVLEEGAWRLLDHSRNTDKDGYQTFCAEDGSFGAVFLVPAGLHEQTLKFTVGEAVEKAPKIQQVIQENLVIAYPDVQDTVWLHLPSLSVAPEKTDPAQYAWWYKSEGESIWNQQKLAKWIRGGRLSPNEDDVDIEYWWQNTAEGNKHTAPSFTLTSSDLSATAKYMILTPKGWSDLADGADCTEDCYAVAKVSADGKSMVALALQTTIRIFRTGQSVHMDIRPVDVPLSKRHFIRGKFYRTSSSLETLQHRILSELF